MHDINFVEEKHSKKRYSIQNLAMGVLSGMVFLGALLLFSIEPLIGRLLTPYFGSAPHVWLVCLMFFQAVLLIGYLYSHLFAKKIGGWHLVLLLLPLVNLPPKIDATPDPVTPLLSIIWTLIFNIALPFLVLSTTAVVAQSWLSYSSLGKENDPYPLYAASNAGSLIALLGYTFIAEPLMGVKLQGITWSLTYVLYAALVVASWFLLRPDKGLAMGRDQLSGPVAIGAATYGKWILLSCLPSAYLLAVTNFISLEVGSFPLTWILPLALYLGSFIVTFRTGGGVPRSIRNLWPEILLAGMIMYLLGPVHWLAILGHLTIFFLVCLVSHGTLYEHRPRPSHLTNFYLSSALGGWIGGALVSLVAPYLFTGLYEYPMILCILSVIFFICHPGTFKTFMPGTPIKIFCIRWTVSMILVAMVFIGTKTVLNDTLLFHHRNFYGTYRIKDVSSIDGISFGMRQLIHGNTVHGAQLLEPESGMTPILYYYDDGAISQVYRAKSSPRQIAILGLGAGVAAAYANIDDTVTYYEIDPDNEMIARRWFSFLEECKGIVRVIVGDGRLAMKRDEIEGTKYDIIHMDAFTGDGIPTHLLTKEAIEIYLNRLNNDGFILFHVSNRYYELRPVIKATTKLMKLHAVTNIPVERKYLKSYQLPSRCVVLANNLESLKPLLDRGWLMLDDDDRFNTVTAWTDDYINILAPLVENIRSKN